MADKHPNPPKPPNNNNAKSIDRWEDEGGAPSGGRPRLKRPRDPAQLAKLMIDIASGEVEDRPPTPEEQGKDPAAVRRGQLGGTKGGKERAANLTKGRRVEIAKKAAKTRWKTLARSD
jgi:hypothetical protein